MKKLKIAGIVLTLFILYVIIGMLVPFVHMQSVSKTNKSKIHTETFYSTSNENGSDRAKIVSDNQEALDLRLDMIRKAKKEIILSTFDIREGDRKSTRLNSSHTVMIFFQNYSKHPDEASR